MIKRLLKLCRKKATPDPKSSQGQAVPPSSTTQTQPAQDLDSSKTYEKRNGEITIAKRINTEASRLQA